MSGSYKIIKLPDFARALEGNLDVDHLVMLGAGASLSSGVPTAKDCIWDWKSDIFLSNNPDEIGSINWQVEADRQRIQAWINSQTGYPKEGSDEEYEFYAEKAYINNELRRNYFEGLVDRKEPGIGYKILALLAEHGVIKIVLTTNFDGLAAKAMNDNGLSPREVTIETSELIHMPMRRKDCFHIALHGDYKYGKLKNTGEELDTQQDDFKVALRIHLYNKHLIVMGYSGRDKSLMRAIEDAYLQEEKGRGILYWCSYSENVSQDVDSLLKRICAKGREAILVVAGDFDDSLRSLGSYCFRRNQGLSLKLGSIVGFEGIEAGEVVVDEVEAESDMQEEAAEGIDTEIERLDSEALDALTFATLLGGWSESDADRNAIEGESDDS